MKIGYTGKESAGKSQLLAVLALDVLARNRKWAEKRKKLGLPHIPRTMAFDTPMSQKYIDAVEKAGHHYVYFSDFGDMLYTSQLDVFIHEISRWFPQRGSEPLTPDQVEFLTQGAKEGNNIYFACQDFSQVHKTFRYLTNHLYIVDKMFGSDRPIASAPPVKYIYGLIMYRAVEPSSFKGDNITMEAIDEFPSFYFINREDAELYDTSYRVRGVSLPPVKMIEQTYIYVDFTGKEIKREKKWVKR